MISLHYSSVMSTFELERLELSTCLSTLFFSCSTVSEYKRVIFNRILNLWVGV